MRGRGEERRRDQGRDHARSTKERMHSREGSGPDIASDLREASCHTLDLHGKMRDDVSRELGRAVSAAIMAGKDTMRIIHGFHGGTVLSKEVQTVLLQLKKQGLIESFSRNPANPGETIAHLA